VSRLLLTVRDLTKHFPLKSGFLGRERGVVQAVDHVSFDVHEGETLGIVGESGCGKSTTARLLVRLIQPDAGEVTFDGATVGRRIGVRELRRQVQMVFQDSYSSLNPRLSAAASIAYGPSVHGLGRRPSRERAQDLLRAVGLEPGLFAGRYPHELSGGQRQRVNIARALALEPRLVILDEAVSALDKSIGAQVLNLLAELKERFRLTYVFISHDLNVVRYVSDRVMVMYLGKVVEIGDVEALYRRPQHPYTRALLSAMPSMDPSRRTLEAPLQGDPPNPINPPSGCRFRTRCPLAEDICTREEPRLAECDPSGHAVACHLAVRPLGSTRAA
jgi:peptide/nickel transport system ATP-binding protein